MPADGQLLIDAKKRNIERLQQQLAVEEEELRQLETARDAATSSPKSSWDIALDLSLDEYARYGRQMIVPGIGMRGQLSFRSAAVLLVGAGGLACPAAAYLAGAGIGTIGIVDGDVVETSNLHRQIVHRNQDVGLSKSESIARFISSLNSNVKGKAIAHYLDCRNALDTLSPYDVIVDCTDTPASRYLVSDACVLSRKPLVSASALRSDGQLMVLNDPPRPPGDMQGGPCYRCVWPKPPPPESVSSCGEAGILGPVVGTMGVLMALETLKLILRQSRNICQDSSPRLTIFSAFSSPQFRAIKLKGRQAACAVCSDAADITYKTLTTGSLDYQKFCGRLAPINLLGPEERSSPMAVSQLMLHEPSHTLPMMIDVRESTEWDIFHLPRSRNIPWSGLSRVENLPENAQTPQDRELLDLSNSCQPLYVICRLGNDSQYAVNALKRLGLDHRGQRSVKDVEGGWERWKREVPGQWPEF